ncbi:hypothetical protein D9M68_615850 [compost metagenome]
MESSSRVVVSVRPPTRQCLRVFARSRHPALRLGKGIYFGFQDFSQLCSIAALPLDGKGQTESLEVPVLTIEEGSHFALHLAFPYQTGIDGTPFGRKIFLIGARLLGVAQRHKHADTVSLQRDGLELFVVADTN